MSSWSGSCPLALLLSVRNVGLGRFSRMVTRVHHVGMGAVGVMSCRLMTARCVVSGSFLMMLRSMLVVLGGLQMMGMSGVGCH